MIDPRIAERFASDNGFPVLGSLLGLGLMGSHSHGTYLPPEDPAAVDDVDYMGFFVPPLDHHLGLPRREHWMMQVEELDVATYSLDKAVRLLLKGNPNILGLLWLRPEEYVYRTAPFDRLVAARELFSSRAAALAFSGYAFGQLKRMEAFDLARMDAYETMTDEIITKGPIAEVLEADPKKLVHLARAWGIPLDRLNAFRKLHHGHFSGYMGAKRKALVRKHQYDVKNGAHLIRLLRMGAEFLATGRLQVYRTEDAEELKAIKRGDWGLDDVKREAARLFAAFEAARATSPLPEHPNTEGANALLVSLHREVLGI